MSGYHSCAQERTRSAQHDAKNPFITHAPRSERRKWMSINGMTSSLLNESSPPIRSLNDTSAHNMPATPSAHNSTGIPPAKVDSSRRKTAASRVGITAKIQRPARIPVADVDHGNDAASATASQSHISTRRSRLNTLAATVACIEV